MNKLKTIKETLLLGPGPSTVSPNVYKAISTKTIGHLDPRFIAIMDSIKVMLRQVFKTENDLCIPVSGTGSAAMESCFVNTIEPKDKVLIIQNGYFGLRMENMCQRLDANLSLLQFEWGESVDVNKVEDHLKNNSYDLVRFSLIMQMRSSNGSTRFVHSKFFDNEAHWPTLPPVTMPPLSPGLSKALGDTIKNVLLVIGILSCLTYFFFSIEHKGFALIDVFSPCVTFNHDNDYPFFKPRVKKLEDEEHDPSDWKSACEKAMVWGDTIYTGLFFQKKGQPSLSELEPVLDEGGPLARRALGLSQEQSQKIIKKMM